MNQIKTLNILKSFVDLSSSSFPPTSEQILLCYLKHFGDFQVTMEYEGINRNVFRVKKNESHYCYRVMKITEVMHEIKDLLVDEGRIEEGDDWEKIVNEHIEADGVFNYVRDSSGEDGAAGEDFVPEETTDFVVVCGVIYYIYMMDSSIFDEE